jgi:lysophospholipase L1-like esterase
MEIHNKGETEMLTGSQKFALMTAIVLCKVSIAFAADNWVGAWGFVPTPPPPGEAAVVITPAVASLAALTPLSTPPVPAAPNAPAPFVPLVDNPGNLAILPNTVELANVTVRQLVRVSTGGKQIRLRLSNEAGASVLPIGAVHVAAAGTDGAILPGTDHAVTFDGNAAVTVPASSPLLSDPVPMQVKPLDRLLISIHLPGPLPRAGHALFQYVTLTPGDNTSAPRLPDAKLVRTTAMVTEVDVNADAPTNVIVTLGDSITEGALSTGNAFRSWPDRLAERLVSARKNWAVVNAGIGGNRLLRNGAGPGALARLDRDVFSVPGVKAIILLEGINDIGRGFAPSGQIDRVTPEALIAADKQIIARAHQKGIKVYGGLLTPYQGANYAAPAGEQVREALNNWIRTSGAFDGVIDFATPVADPTNLLTFDAKYNDRDHLHPNDSGYQIMANAIDLAMVAGK